MSYTIYTSEWRGQALAPRPSAARVVIVGVGGTGGFLAEPVCRLLLGIPSEVFLIDPDVVEEHNVARQNFDLSEVGGYKAEVLARRLSRRFRREVGYSTLPFSAVQHGPIFSGFSPTQLNLLIGCVDNPHARTAIRDAFRDQPAMRRAWWLDSGNGKNDGQILLGNTATAAGLHGAFLEDAMLCTDLPLPTLQRPDLLDAVPEQEPQLDCAELVEMSAQGPTINQMMATFLASYVEKLLLGCCQWMATYLDVDHGMFRSVFADPKLAAQYGGLHVNAVVTRTRKPRGGAAAA